MYYWGKVFEFCFFKIFLSILGYDGFLLILLLKNKIFEKKWSRILFVEYLVNVCKNWFVLFILLFFILILR